VGSNINHPEWELEAWEKAFTINVGRAYVCRECDNLVMVTKGGVGSLDLKCCNKQMEIKELIGDKDDR